MSVYTEDLKTFCSFVIRDRFKPRWLSPSDNWIKNPRDAGLWSEEKAQLHIKNNQARVYQPLDKAVREYRVSLTAKKGFTPPF